MEEQWPLSLPPSLSTPRISSVLKSAVGWSNSSFIIEWSGREGGRERMSSVRSGPTNQSLCSGVVCPRATSVRTPSSLSSTRKPRGRYKRPHFDPQILQRRERGGGRVSRPDTSLIGCLDWSRHKRSPLSIPLPLPLSPLRPFSFHRPSPRHHQAAPSCRCCSTSLFTFSRSPHNQSRPRPTFRPRKFVPKNIWRLILTLSLSLNLYPRCPLL